VSALVHLLYSKKLNLTFHVLNAWLRNQALQYHDDIKIFFQPQSLKL